jgi:putative acyl-CoA dehydrogenase
MRLARAVDEASSSPEAMLMRRLGVAVAKYRVCKAAVSVVAEAVECLGGNGYVEDSVLPLLYRETPLNSIWEGSGNVNALDVLRIVTKTPEALELFLHEVELAAGSDGRLDAHVAGLKRHLRPGEGMEGGARRIAESLALALQASLLVRHSPPEVADAFCASRLGGEGGRAYGTLPDGLALEAIIDRHRPRIA